MRPAVALKRRAPAGRDRLVLAKGDDIAPIPAPSVLLGEENIAADRLDLTAEQLEQLETLPAAGDTQR